MSSISVGELKAILEDLDDFTEVVMNFRCKYAISKEENEKGWIAYINGVQIDKEHNEVRLMN